LAEVGGIECFQFYSCVYLFKKTECWFVGGDDLTGAELCTTYSSSSPVVTTTSIILCFNKHRLTQVYLVNGHQNGERGQI